MDRRTNLAIALSLAIYLTWSLLRAPTPKPGAESQEGPAALSTPVEATASAPAPPVPAAPAPPDRTVEFHACGAKAKVSSDGGRLHELVLDGYTGSFEVTPLYSWLIGQFTGSFGSTWQPYGASHPAMPLSDRSLALSAGVGPRGEALPMAFVDPVDGASGKLELVGTTSQGVEVRKTFTEHRVDEDTCWVDVAVTWTNRTASAVREDLWVSVLDHPHVGSRYDAQQPMVFVDGRLTYGGASGAGWFGCGGTQLSEPAEDIPLQGPVSWFGQSDRYFGFFVVPEKAGDGALSLHRDGEGDAALDGAVVRYPGGLPAGYSRTETYKAYAGPLVDAKLREIDPTLPNAIDLGFWAFFGYPLLFTLRLLHSALGNWGLAIIGLTVLVKVAFYKLSERQMVAGEQMKKIQPELNAVREQFADNPQEMQRRTMEIMTKHGVNPLSGCLPLLVQMPVWLALNQVLLTSVDLHHARFLYLRDLTAADPYLILPVSITAMMAVQQAMTPTTGLDPAQAQVMRYMPFLFGLMFFAFPSGLAVYVFVNMVLTIVQQWIIKRSIGSEAMPTAAAAR